jgi:2-methylcitrate dehydratase PrpD
LSDPEVLELAARIELVAHDDFAASFPEGTPCRVVMDQGEGPQSLTVLHPLGDVANPMSRAQVTEKFRRISAVSVGPGWQDEILAALDGLLAQGFGPLFAALAAPRLILASERSQSSIWR